MDGSHSNCAEWNKPSKKKKVHNTVWLHLYKAKENIN